MPILGVIETGPGEVITLQEAKRGVVLLTGRWVVARAFVSAVRLHRAPSDHHVHIAGVSGVRGCLG